jgi:hypothetical protein
MTGPRAPPYQKRLGGGTTDAGIDCSNIRPPAKQQLTIRPDADVLAWIKATASAIKSNAPQSHFEEPNRKSAYAPIPDRISPSPPPRILLRIRVHAWRIFPVPTKNRRL